jgi:hypothetical protein
LETVTGLLFLVSPLLKTHIMKKLLFAIVLFASCSKDDPCTGPGNITVTSRSIIGWENNVNVIIEVKGLDNPYHGFIEPLSTKEHRIEGHAMVRVRSKCSDYSNWIEIGY